MGTFDKMEEYLASVEEYFFTSLSAVAHGLPDVHEVANRLWIDISRYGPGLPAFPEVRIPSLGDFQVPPPPPPPPAPPATRWAEVSSGWIAKHPWKTTGVVMSAVGTGLLVSYSITRRKRRGPQRLRAQQAKSTDRRQVVVVLGADSPFGLPLILDLEKKGYIVIASVATPEAVDPLEQQTQGYVKALVLDPYEPLMIPTFLRSLAATLSRKFPIGAAGDPYASLSSHPYIHSIISLLTLPTTKTATHTLAPLEHVSLPDTYLPYLTATHVTPLQVIQALLPLIRTGPAIMRDQGYKKTIVVCLPATDVRVGLPFAGVRAMSAAAMERGVEVLRREVRAAGVTGKGAEVMKNLRVVVVDVGVFDFGVGVASTGAGTGMEEMGGTESVWKAMERWTASEKVTYGPAFASVLQGSADVSKKEKTPWETFVAVFKGTHRYGVHRKPTDVSVFVKNVVDVVSGGRGAYRIYGIDLGLGKIMNWVRGERLSVGAGAHTYKFASYLPSALLDVVLNIPHFLIGVRNRLLMTQPFRLPPTNLPPPAPAPAPAANTTQPKVASTTTSQSSVHSQTQNSAESQETPSEHESSSDVESVSGESSSGVDSSWVSLNGSQTNIQEDSTT
ncbi:hypothetical protein P691DRAFT_692277 [Macrolepiota fuliginosa MF-IS2]|uniref:DUF1776-domain-containing protein n=1 Tax=Macrolepiota fuliginosa MF-IS2 TaxID=1400762 RepID=A0A9P5XPK0_9AGAR|nr:hypothetical protein P691DRAFT_692277 [Macrolepiota fuliginosa MF-IS2]